MNLNPILSELSEIDFYELVHRIDIAQNLRAIEKRYKKNHQQMADGLNVPVEVYVKYFRTGAKDFSVMDIAKMEALESSFYSEINSIVTIPMDKK